MNDPQLLSADLAAKSLSSIEIVLPYQEALKAVESLTAQGYFTFAWEGWVKIRDGRHGHSSRHQGTHDFWGTKGQPIPVRIQEAASYARQTIEAAQQEFDDKPEFEGATLHFCLTIQSGSQALENDRLG
jgi:hypothetical protein